MKTAPIEPTHRLELLNPHQHCRPYPDARSREVMQKTIGFFEERGHDQLRADYIGKAWYAEFLDYVKRERLFATLLTPAGLAPESRWDTWRNCEFAEILSFYGLQYWYVWQVTVLGLGPLWMTEKRPLKEKAVQRLAEGGIFAFGLSEKAHGADIYSTEMRLFADRPGQYRARGNKYYIGNGNRAAMVSTFGKFDGSDEYVFFAVDPLHPKYRLIKNVVNSQSYVAEYSLDDYPVEDGDLIARGPAAWDAALNTVNIGKYNLGWASIGIATHAFYEAIRHAANRRLYGMAVTDFPHVKQMFVDAYTRLIAMKAFALRAADYMRSASPQDRRYLLYNPLVKMKVTTQGEEVIDLLWDVIAAKGFEKDMYFSEAATEIRALPKLEGTVHVNIALIVKFMENYFFNPRDYPVIPRRDDAADDTCLFQQGSTRGLGKIQFHDSTATFAAWPLPNVEVFRSQIEAFKEMLVRAAPDEAQEKDADFLLTVGQIFAQIVYAGLILENAQIYQLSADMVDQIFDFMVRDIAKYALQLHGKPSTTSSQIALCLKLIQRPVFDAGRYERIFRNTILPLRDVYAMKT